HKLDPKTQQNRSLEHHYEVEGFLGEGRFGIVTKCRNTKTNKVVAIKVNKRNHKILATRVVKVKRSTTLPPSYFQNECCDMK
uniref:Protein kinase domain-containing protein n=1 Tax=Neolamprologus brichardi TaxID=32507 RepID=A0A3Q4G9P8_NEOBR